MTTKLWSTQYDMGVHVDDLCWANILDLACAYGWQPAGTAPPYNWNRDKATPEGKQNPWSGEYATPCWQEVSHEDAILMADALETALAETRELIYLSRSGSFLIA